MKAVLILSLIALGSAAHAEDLTEKLAAGEALYKKDCTGCHGEFGVGSAEGRAPHLAGQRARYVKNELLAFQSGKREGTMMGSWLSAYSEKDFENLGLYIQTLKRPCE